MRSSEARPYVEHAVKEAERLKNRAGGVSKLYIDAEQTDVAAKEGDQSAEIAILRKLVKKAPGDIEARIFLSEAVGDGYDEAGEPKAGQKESIALLENVLRDAPNDSAANHFGFTPSSLEIIPSWRSRARRCWPAWLRTPATWSTCRGTSTIA